MTLGVVAPFYQQAGRVEPYLTTTEVTFSATAAALDFTQLVPNGDDAQQLASLQELIVRASSKIDAYTMGKLGTLNATVNTENGRYRVTRDGTFRVHPSFTPILQVMTFSWGQQPGAVFSVPLSANNCWVERDTFVILNQGASGSIGFSGTNALSNIAGSWTGTQYCEWTYVNGWANSFTTADVSATGASIPLTDATGLYPGSLFTIWDGANDEYCQAASNYDGVSLTIPLVTPLSYDHVKGTNASQLPAVVKQAAIHFVCGLVTARGQGGLSIGSAGEVVESGGSTKGLGIEHEMAGYDLLDEFRSVSGRM